ncbi:MAG: MFS transporter, partial [Alphaproteobacteria bacterium]
AVLVSQWRHVRDDTRPEPSAAAPDLREQFQALATPTILMFFIFFTLTAFATNGIHSFTVVALVELRGMPLTAATSALTGYLIASAVGVLAGGFVADKITRHGAMAACALLISAFFLMAMVSISFPVTIVVTLMTLVGLFQGSIRPARDMLIRAVLPKASFGKAVGIVATGAAFGGALAPFAFGWIMDLGKAELVFYVLVISVVLMAATILVAGRKVPAS